MDPDFNRKLIHEIKKYECLYNMASLEFRHVKLKKRVWEKISEKLQKKTSACQKRWKTLRDAYTRMKRLEAKALRENNPRPPKSFKLASELTFLDGAGTDDYDGDNEDMHYKLEISNKAKAEDFNSTNNTQSSYNDDNDAEDVDKYYDEDCDSNMGASSSNANFKTENNAMLQNTIPNNEILPSDPLVMRNSTFIFFESLAHKVLSAGMTQEDVDTLELKVAAVVYKEIANCRNKRRIT
ncbi:uncharacterized protein [Eurosta solidaginis]|uniref:uncharacterized protein n=1 Tax=Eurosta solidaginis TaxID=178769 RepID=UPI0035314EE1